MDKICDNCRFAHNIYGKEHVYCEKHNTQKEKNDTCEDFRKERQ